MTNRFAATRYARALFDVARAEADPQQVERELTRFVELVQAHPELWRVLTNAAIPAARKRAVVVELTGPAREIGPILTKLLLMLADRDRLVLLPDLLAAYRDRLMEFMQIVRADVTTAAPIGDDKTRAIEAGLSHALGKRVIVESRVDAALIGGVVAKIGSVVYDGSVSRQLERIKEQLTES